MEKSICWGIRTLSFYFTRCGFGRGGWWLKWWGGLSLSLSVIPAHQPAVGADDVVQRQRSTYSSAEFKRLHTRYQPLLPASLIVSFPCLMDPRTIALWVKMCLFFWHWNSNPDTSWQQITVFNELSKTM